MKMVSLETAQNTTYTVISMKFYQIFGMKFKLVILEQAYIGQNRKATHKAWPEHS